MLYWEKQFEICSRNELEKFQVKRLNSTLESANRSPYYNALFNKKGISPGSIKNVAQIQDLPFPQSKIYVIISPTDF